MFCPFCGARMTVGNPGFCPACGRSSEATSHDAPARPEPIAFEPAWERTAERRDTDSMSVFFPGRCGDRYYPALGWTFAVVSAVLCVMAGTGLGVMAAGLIRPEYFDTLRPLIWGVPAAALASSAAIVAVSPYHERGMRSSSDAPASRTSLIRPMIVSLVSSVLAVALCVTAGVWAMPRDRFAHAAAMTECADAADRLASTGKKLWSEIGTVSRHDVTDPSVVEGLSDLLNPFGDILTCSETSATHELQTATEAKNDRIERMTRAVVAVRQSLKTRSQYTLKTLAGAVSDGSLRGISGEYCRNDGDCVTINDTGLHKSVGVGYPFANGEYYSALKLDGLDDDASYALGAGFTLTGPDDDFVCAYGSGNECDDAPNYTITSRPVMVQYFREGTGLADDALCRLNGYDEGCSDRFVRPDGSRPFLLIPLTSGAVGYANEPSDGNVYYLQDRNIADD